MQESIARFGPRPFDDQFRMLAPEGFRDMAIPANRSIFGEDLWQLFRTNLVPLDGLAVGVQQGRPLAPKPIDALDRFAAILANFPCIPLGDGRPDQTVFGSSFNLA